MPVYSPLIGTEMHFDVNKINFYFLKKNKNQKKFDWHGV